MTLRAALAVAVLAVLSGCPKPAPGGGGPGPVPSHRCEVDLDGSGHFSQVGTGATASVIERSDQLLGGQFSDGRIGDLLLQNDRVRVVISKPGRFFSTLPFGGWIIDADLKRAAGEPGRDQFGKLAIFHSFGRTINAETVEVLDDGSQGGPAIIAATGKDALNDFLNLPEVMGEYLPDVKPVVDGNIPVPLKATTYYVLSPGETRVRVYTAFCNEGAEVVSIPLADVLDQGGTTEFFNPEGCAGTLGNDGCLADPTHGFGWQGDGVAYGYRGYKFDAPTVPSDDALVNVIGPVGVLAGAESSQGLLTWVDASATKRPGAFGIREGESRSWLRDFYVTRDLAEWSGTLLAADGKASGRLKVAVRESTGGAAAGARVSVFGGDGRMVTVMVTDSEGRAHADVPPGNYKLYAGFPSRSLSGPFDALVGTGGTTELPLGLVAHRALTVEVKDPFGAPMPAKVTVLCPAGTCPTPLASYGRIADLETTPTNVAAIGYVPPSGVLTLPLSPGAYELVVTRGPEFSAFPDGWPAAGHAVDLTAADQTVTATLARVVDTTGWISADLHVHAVNSADSSVPNEQRVLSFMAEGVDVLVSTDHDYITDFGPAVTRLGGEGVIATMIGSEVSTFDFGHFNAYPMVRRDEPRGGPFDWAGGAEGPTLRATQLFAGLRADHPDTVIQVNHGRGDSGLFTQVRVDTDTFATHEDPGVLRMHPAPDATAADTKLMDANFDAVEVVNGLNGSTTLLNDWMTMLSTGRRKAGTAVSDSHSDFKTVGGYSRTYVELPGVNAPAQFDPKVFAANMKALQVFGTNGPFMKVSARKVDSAGMPVGDAVSLGGTLSVNAAAMEAVELTVDVQTPAWIRFDTLEVYTHADGREALNGAANTDWKPPLVSRKLDPLALTLEPVPGGNGLNFNRVHVTERFVVTPAEDTWYVVILRSSSAVATMYPLAYDGMDCNGNLCTARAGRPYAFSNPIFVDADASGAYDKFPQKIPLRVHAPPGSPKPLEALSRRVPTLEELHEAIRHVMAHEHE